MIIRELITRLGFRADNRAADRHERALRRVRNAAMAVTAAYTATVGAMAALSSQYAENARQVENQSRLANATTTEFQRMAGASKEFGIEQDKLADILKDVNDRIGDFVQTGGGPMADFFENIGPKVGVTAESFRDLSGPQALQLYVDSLEKANLSQADMTFYMEAMASDSTALLPLLHNNGAELARLGDEAERSGALMSTAGIAAAKTYRASMITLREMVDGVRITLTEGLLPTVAETVESFAAWWKINRELVLQNVSAFVDQLIFSVRILSGMLGYVAERVNDVVQYMGGWERVLRTLALAVSGFIGLKLGGALWGIVAALGAAVASGGALRLAMLALSRVPLILGLTLLAAFIEDVVVWINDGDSAIGRWLGSWEEFSAKIKPIVDKIRGYLEALNPQFAAMGEVLAGALTVDPARTIQGLNTLGDEMIIWVLKVGGDIADYLMEALTPDTDAIMAAMRQLGQDMLDWAKGVGQAIAEALIPQAALQFMGGRQDPGDEDAPPAPDDTSAPADPLVLPPSEPTPTPAERMSGAFNTPTPEQVQQSVSASNTSTTRNVSVNARIESTLQVPPGTPQEQQAALRREAESTFNELFNRELSRTLNDMPEAN